MAPLINQTSSFVFGINESKANMDNIFRFVEISRQATNSFISKYAIWLNSEESESILAEEISKLKFEIEKKEKLLAAIEARLEKCRTKLDNLYQ